MSSIPTLADFDRVVAAPVAQPLSVPNLARKLADACDASRLWDDAHVIEVLVAAGVRPSDVDASRWSDLKVAAARLIGIQGYLRTEAMKAAAVGLVFLAATLFGTFSALASWDGPVISDAAGALILAIMGALAVVMFVRSLVRRDRGPDPHAEPWGDVPRRVR